CTPDDPDIYALGECAQHRGRTYGLVAPLWEQAHVLSDRLAGRRADATYVGSKTATKVQVMGVDLVAIGEQSAANETDEEVTYVEKSRGIYKKLIIREGSLAGAILVGDASTAAQLLHLFDRGLEVPNNRSELLFPGAGSEAKEP